MLSPRYRSGGSLMKLGTDSKGISGTFTAFAFVCAESESRPPLKTTAATNNHVRRRLMWSLRVRIEGTLVFVS
jgi:hypothetical protein